MRGLDRPPLEKIGVLICVAIVLGAAVAQASDWPTYRHDPARTGWTPDRLTLPLEVRWIYTAPGQPRMAWAGMAVIGTVGWYFPCRMRRVHS